LLKGPAIHFKALNEFTMILSRYTLKNISHTSVMVPDEAIFDLPEKVLQFGTGVLLRGLPDYFIDKANRSGLFNGRIVVVKSTAHGDSSAFEKQDGLYTLCVRGIEDGNKIEENSINASISRVLSAQNEWEQILQCAHNPDLKIIISNTTEVGIQLLKDDIHHHPPVSFPGKLLAFLYERFKAFSGSEHSGLVIVPTELIPDNGEKLESIVLELAHLNSLADPFIAWLEQHNHFCNSLVDRIVPGKPDTAMLSALEAELGYTDQLMTMAEVYRLWAIEGDEQVKGVLSFARADKGVIIEPDIDSYRELKLRLLNGTHTLSCGLAFLAGCETVRQAMEDEIVAAYIKEIMQQELAPSIPYPIDPSLAQEFGNKVLDRFRNPQIKHQWINITVQYSSKMKMRTIPILLKHYQTYGTVPELFALGFASYLQFMRPVKEQAGQYYGELNGKTYLIQDDRAAIFYKRWQTLSKEDLVKEVLQDTAFWDEDLSLLPGFYQSVLEKLELINEDIRKALEFLLIKNAEA
jgi:tagaturonate reductase